MAKKKYYQSVSDRMAESRGMERYETKKKMKKNGNKVSKAKRINTPNARSAYPEMNGWLSYDMSSPSGFPMGAKVIKANSYQGDDAMNIYVPGSSQYMDNNVKKNAKILKRIIDPQQV